jgi:hypothetical protein
MKMALRRLTVQTLRHGIGFHANGIRASDE